MILYFGFHIVGVLLIVQKELLTRVIGAFWLLLSMGVFNYGLYKVMREICYVREVKVNYQPE